MRSQIQVQIPKVINPLCSYSSSIELTSHFVLRCPIFNDKRHTLLSTLNNIDSKILVSADSYLTKRCFMVLLRLIQKQTRFFLT